MRRDFHGGPRRRSVRAWMGLAVAAVLLAVQAGCGPGGGERVAMTGKEREHVRRLLADMKGEVELVVFSRGDSSSTEAMAIYQGIAGVQPKVRVQGLSLKAEAAEAAAMGVTEAPVAVVRKGDNDRIRFFGTPSGYELTPFLEMLGRLDRGETGLSEEAARAVAELSRPAVLKIFVTPS